MKYPSPLWMFRGPESHTVICSSLEYFEVNDILILRIVQNPCASKDYLSQTPVWGNAYWQGQLLIILILSKDLQLLSENKDLYKCTRQEPWSQNIKRRRLRWLGHLMRLPVETPAQQALQESICPTKRLRKHSNNTNTSLQILHPQSHETGHQTLPQKELPLWQRSMVCGPSGE